MEAFLARMHSNDHSLYYRRSSRGTSTRVGGASTGWYWMMLAGVATQVYVDNEYQNGGWVLVATHPLNVALPAFTYEQTTTNLPQLGSAGFTVGSGDPKAYATLMPLGTLSSVCVLFI